ncbi:AAA family ATPase [Pseudomonas lundensis]|uniref:AAA family ATPase n=1 Tax=Pseudomonas lundensis TaxID=86185 RepID=UPI000BA2539E|nr:AAA family ATPase [Pseudomonas lundensis]NLT99799.1 AAA family ATPase [Pseudomonas lundensis]NNA09452.1 AAA family ATPase [Pseudomonas lundensis]OZY31095.1 chromosome partitioning protein ParA [Pseudomonas lundensis]QPF15662.1 AAA family ATPase [Pseudomonas lundensis]
MSIILIGNTKGGIGKSTNAVQVAVGRAIQGKDVLLVNADRQSSSSKAIARRDEAGLTPSVTLVAYPDGEQLRTQVLRQAGKYDDIIIDAGGRDSSALRHAMMIADVMLVPIAPGNFELDALEDELVPLINEIQASRGDNPLPIYAYLNMAEANKFSSDNLDTRRSIESFPELQLLDLNIVKRKAIATASTTGLSVREMKTKDFKAVKEIDALLAALFN